MSRSANDDHCHLGFLRVAQTEHGFVGGLLVTNRLGRPLEFQCTTPVRPTKTHEILYGVSLQPYVFNELIGKTLVERLGIKPQVVFVQQDMLLGLRMCVNCPVFLVDTKAGELADQTILEFGPHRLRRHLQFPADEEFLADLAESIPGDADLAEPLERVQDALKETLRANAVA